MKNSPGSMIGGIGLTIWVRAVQFSRTIPRISSTRSSSMPTQDRRVRLLEEPARGVQPGRPVLVLQQGVDQRAGVLVVDDRDDELHRPEYRCAQMRTGTPAGRRMQPQRAASEDRPRMDPVADILARAAATLAASDDLDASVGALLEVAAESLGSSFAAVTLQDPDRAGLQVAVAFGADAAARDEFETAYVGPDGPVAQTAADRVARMGEDLIHLPLAVTRGGIDQLVGVLTIGRAGDAEPDDDERTTLGALAALIAVAVDRARLGSMIAERSEWFERMAHTDPLTGLANERTFGRILELELARAGRQGGEVSLALFDVDDLTAHQRDRRAFRGRRRPARRRGGPRRIGPARGHRRPDRRR